MRFAIFPDLADTILTGIRRVGKAQRAHHSAAYSAPMVGTAQVRLCPPYFAVMDAPAGSLPLVSAEALAKADAGMEPNQRAHIT
ncbi:hypothetical protein V1292_000058 [Bradyrhizobium sp. AZCC 1719]